MVICKLVLETCMACYNLVMERIRNQGSHRLELEGKMWSYNWEIEGSMRFYR